MEIQDSGTNQSSPRAALWLAATWGLAEAVCFFVVPDVLTSRLVLQRPRLGLMACGASLAGALLGGTLLFLVTESVEGQQQVLQAFDHIPGINAELIESARADLTQRGAWALFSGMFVGVPYKLYAAQAVTAGLSLAGFLLASAVARLTRFLLVTALAWGVSRTVLRSVLPRRQLTIHAGAWVVFYVFYFWKMGW